MDPQNVVTERVDNLEFATAKAGQVASKLKVVPILASTFQIIRNFYVTKCSQLTTNFGLASIPIAENRKLELGTRN